VFEEGGAQSCHGKTGAKDDHDDCGLGEGHGEWRRSG
jgi:hypothetical protein